jgi:hypothetical protein
LPHLNTIEGRLGNRALWRNVVPFSPLAKAPANDSAGSFSYSDVLLQPAAEAINSVANNNTFVEFALTGEQGLSTWTYPREYLQLLHEMKNITLRYVVCCYIVTCWCRLCIIRFSAELVAPCQEWFIAQLLVTRHVLYNQQSRC